MNNACFIYILECNDKSYYVGHTDNIDDRMIAHHTKAYDHCYTAIRLPVKLVFIKEFPTRDEAFKFERQIKGWSRVKKEALIQGGFEAVRKLNRDSKNKNSLSS